MKHSSTRELFDYWNDLRGERTAPERGDIDPAAIRNILADTFMLDVDATHRFPFRLAGTRVNGLFDAEQKGRSFLSLWKAEERRNVAAVLLTVADGCCPVVAGGVAAPIGQEEGGFEVLLLPLRHYGKTHARILGIVVATTRPAWLGILPIGPLGLRSLRIVGESEAPAMARLPNRTSGGGAVRLGVDRETLETMLLAAKAKPARPVFRVIEGGLGRP